MTALGIPVLRWTSRTPRWRRALGGQHPARGGRGGRRARRRPSLVYRAFNERSGRRFGQPQAGVGARPPGSSWNMYLPYGLDTPAKMYSLWFQRVHAALRRDQRRLRSLHGGGAAVRGDQPERVVLRAADHARRPPGVAVDRRAGDPPPRLLPGERRRRRDGGHHRGARRATSGSRSCAIAAATQSHTINGNMTFNYWHRRPRRCTARRSTRPTSCTRTAGIGPDDIDVGDHLRELQPGRLLPARGVRLLRSGRGEGLHRRRQHRAPTASSR